jgi:arsenate reductase
MEDPAEVEGSDAVKRAAFRTTAVTLARRIDLLLALPIASLEQRVRDERVRSIGASE